MFRNFSTMSGRRQFRNSRSYSDDPTRKALDKELKDSGSLWA